MSWVASPTRGSSLFLGKVTALGVLFCFALVFFPIHAAHAHITYITYMYFSSHFHARVHVTAGRRDRECRGSALADFHPREEAEEV